MLDQLLHYSSTEAVIADAPEEAGAMPGMPDMDF